MTPEEIRIAVAEECNYFWTATGIERNNFYLVNPSAQNDKVSRPSQKQIEDSNNVFAFVPNYPFDLSAMHEAEKTLPVELITDYINQLYSITFKPGRDRDYGVVFATALQRAEAFLRVKGKWRE